MNYSTILKHCLIISILTGLAGWSYGQETAQEWPGEKEVSFVDKKGQGLGDNSSGITYQPPLNNNPGYLWIVKNDPPTLYKMQLNDSGKYINVTTQGWKKGKILKYKKNAKGKPDAEGVTKASWSEEFIYVATEKKGIGFWAFFRRIFNKRHLSILRYDVSKESDELVATHEWNLADDIRKKVNKRIGLNKGWEAITWIPDPFLTSRKFYDESSRKTYVPSDYCNHYGGLFFVGLEQTGFIYAYALEDCGKSTQIAEFPTGWDQVVGLEFDRKNEVLWANCDDDCSSKNELKVFQIDNKGHFVLKSKQIYKKPEDLICLNSKGLSCSNYEGIAFSPDKLCASSSINFFWVNDDGVDGETIIQGKIKCPLP